METKKLIDELRQIPPCFVMAMEDRYIQIGELAHAAARAIEEMEEAVWINKKREVELNQLFEDLAGRG